jgi:hypothetical protein
MLLGRNVLLGMNRSLDGVGKHQLRIKDSNVILFFF